MASGFTTKTDTHLIRTDVWSKQIKQLLMDDLFAMKFVRILTDFPDGTTLHIPSLGEAETNDFSEGQAIKYNKFTTGDFEFEFDQYNYSATYISEKFKRDSFYTAEVLAAFVPRMHRALMERVEVKVLSIGNAAQTASDLNTINEASHRWVGSGTSESIALVDFAKAAYALRKANIPQSNLVAIVDPTTAYTLETQTNLVNLMSPQPLWGRIVNEGLVTGTNYRFSIFGFDVYVSNYLPRGISETVDGKTVTTGVANMFFSAAPGDTLPIIGGFRQMPTVQSEFNKDLQQTEYLMIQEYGFRSYREENMVIVLTDTDVVA